MGRLGASAGAGTSPRTGNALQIQEEQHHAVLFVGWEIRIEHGVQAVTSIRTRIEPDPWNRRAQTLHQFRLQALNVRRVRLHVGHGQFKRLGQSNDADEVFGATAHGPLLAAPHDLGTNAVAVFDVQETCAFGTVELVCAAGCKINRHVAQIHRVMPHGLNGIRMKEGIVVPAALADGFYVLKDADFVVAMHDRHHGGDPIRQRDGEVMQVDFSRGIELEQTAGDVVPFAQMLGRFEDGAVLCGTGQNPFAAQLIDTGMQRHVVGFGPATGKTNRSGFHAELPRDLSARLLYGGLRAPPKLVRRRWISEMVPHVREHSLDHFWKHGSRGSIVKVHVHCVVYLFGYSLQK